MFTTSNTNHQRSATGGDCIPWEQVHAAMETILDHPIPGPTLTQAFLILKTKVKLVENKWIWMDLIPSSTSQCLSSPKIAILLSYRFISCDYSWIRILSII